MSERNEVRRLVSGGIERRYVVHTPPGFTPERRRPAVLMLDGRGGTPWTGMKSTGLNAKADAEDFLAVYPEALRLHPDKPMHVLTNPQMWNAGIGGSDVERDGVLVDDLAFLLQVIDDIRDHANADPTRIYVMGFSNGGSMTFRLAAAAPDVIAAAAPIAGHWRDRKAPGSVPFRPVPLMMLFGALDPLSPVRGGEVDLPWGRREYRPPARESAIAWARWSGLGDEPVDIDDNGDVRWERFGPDPRGVEVRFGVISDLGHVWPGGHRLLPESLVGRSSDALNATDTIWSFFQNHSIG